MFEYGLRVCGASLESARLVQSGAYRLAFNPAGGSVTAMASRASGFGVFNVPQWPSPGCWSRGSG